MRKLNYQLRCLLLAAVLPVLVSIKAEASNINFRISEQGELPVWLVCGPFTQPLTGFGTVGDADAVGEATVHPAINDLVDAPLNASGSASWRPVSAGSTGYVDINGLLGLVDPADTPEVPWFGRAGYALTYINSPEAREAVLLLGSYNRIKVIVNGETVYNHDGLRKAVADQDTVRIHLQQGENTILLKVFHSHQDYQPRFLFDPGYGWGFYARLIDSEFQVAENLTVSLPETRNAPKFEVESTIFFRKTPAGQLQQRCDLVLSSIAPEAQSGRFILTMKGKEIILDLPVVPFGESRHSLFIPALEKPVRAQASLKLGDQTVTSKIQLEPRRRYELYLMLLSHLDIGYTHIQPVVIERQVRIMDEAIDRCAVDPAFRWTIETIWQVEQYQRCRPADRFQRLIELIRNGRIAVSPLYTNSFTGLVSEEEMQRAFYPAGDYREQYGIDYHAAIYNDTPGFNWLLPQLLSGLDIDFLVTGINEVYTENPLQRNLPKVFRWEGGDGSSVLTYVTETYNEGLLLGLETETTASEYRIWQRLNKLEHKGYPYDLVLVNAGAGDNCGIPEVQYQRALAWNEEYAYPRFVISNLNQFANDFSKKYAADIPVIRGDWTSSWDSRSQGEPALIRDQRATQNRILTAEKLATINWLKDARLLPLTEDIDDVYRQLLLFSGHGSGLEYGYGSRAENLLAADYRHQYIERAKLGATEVLERSLLRLSIPGESLDSEALLVFNPLSWERSAVVRVDYPAAFAGSVTVRDLVSGETVPSFCETDRLYLSLDKLPSIGYKKYEVIRSSDDHFPNGGLENGPDFIANTRFKLTFDPQTGRIISIYDRRNQREIIAAEADRSFAAPLKIEPFSNDRVTALDTAAAKIRIIDRMPIALDVEIVRPGQLFSESRYRITALDRIEITHTVNLEKLIPAQELEEYGLAFPVALNENHFAIDQAGGQIVSSDDILPGAVTGYFSVRGGFTVYDSDYSVSLALPDSRVIKGETHGSVGGPFSVVLVNNFPVAWNRSERNIGSLDFRFVLTATKNAFDPAAGLRFSREVQNPPEVLRTWQKRSPATASYFSSSNPDILITALSPSRDQSGLILRIRNLNGTKPARGILQSEFFTDRDAWKVSIWGKQKHGLTINQNLIGVTLQPNEIQTIKIVPRP
ncbi:MAG: hypothetical protein ABIA75_05415 [Candidatus Neomarinimicrobiota bacterium]